MVEQVKKRIQDPKISIRKETKVLLDEFKPSSRATYDDTLRCILKFIPKKVKEEVQEMKGKGTGEVYYIPEMVLEKFSVK